MSTASTASTASTQPHHSATGPSASVGLIDDHGDLTAWIARKQPPRVTRPTSNAHVLGPSTPPYYRPARYVWRDPRRWGLHSTAGASA